MKITYKILPLLCATALTAACKKETTPATPQNDKLKIDIALNSQTKTPITGVAFANTSKINVILLDAGATAAYGVMDIYTLDRQDPAQPGNWIPLAGEGLIVKLDEAKVLAHYPADNSLKLSADKQTITPTTPDTLAIGENNTSSLYEAFQIALDPAKPADLTEVFAAKADIDVMTGVGTNVKMLGYVKSTTITMKHTKAMVVVRLKLAADFTGDSRLKRVSFNNAPGNTTLQKGDFKIEDNSFTPTRVTGYQRTMADFAPGTHFALLAYPASIEAEKVQMKLVIGNLTYVFKVPSQNWESGKVYLYTVNMVGNSVVLDDQVLVYDWPAVIEHKVDLE